MRYYLVLLLFEGLVSFVLKDLFNREILALSYLILNVFFFILYFYKKSNDKTLFMILVSGLMIRMAGLYYDRTITWLPFNTTDAQMFHRHAVETANALPDTLLEHYTGFYSQVLGVIYYIFGPYQFFGHFLNISFVMLAATKLMDVADLMRLTPAYKKMMISIWMFAPIPFLMSYALLREGSIYYFVVLSIYHFLRWTKHFKWFDIIIAILSVGIGAKYHEGILVIGVVYLYTFLFYDRQNHKIKMNWVNVVCLITTFILFLAFIGSEAGQEYINKTNAETGGGSAYLTSLKVETPIDFLLTGPIKAFYLVYSPMPWLIRGGMDIITFLFDSSLWIYTTYLFIKDHKKIPSRYKLLMLCGLLGSFVYGMGTLNTGTAIRHRNKFISFVLILMIAIKNQRSLEQRGDHK